MILRQCACGDCLTITDSAWTKLKGLDWRTLVTGPNARFNSAHESCGLVPVETKDIPNPTK